ncbi:MAG: 3-deoxy-D-manno-octulosonic acid transferase [Lentisphaeria bacterium]
MLFFYNLLFPFLFVLYLPMFVSKLIRRGGSRRHFAERFGLFSADRKSELAALQKPIWIHAVSVGEAVAACTFIRKWHERDPHLQFVLSTTTTTGHAIAEKKLPSSACLIYCPLDFYPFVRRTLKLLQPAMLVIFEVEIWPNLVSLTANRGIPVALVNARMSDKSARGYAKHKWLFGKLFRRFSIFCTQSREDAERIRRVVGDDVPVYECNTMKFDQVVSPDETPDPTILDKVFGAVPRTTWVAASTHAGEEAMVVRIFKKLAPDLSGLKMVLVPRHHERTAEVERIMKENGLSYARFTDLKSGDGKGEPVECLLVNTTGELMQFMAMADIIYMGKTMAGNSGGHNIIEPAILGKPVVHGPHMENFRLVIEAFRKASATLEVNDPGELEAAIRELYADEEKRLQLGRTAQKVVEQSRGTISRTLDLLDQL